MWPFKRDLDVIDWVIAGVVVLLVLLLIGAGVEGWQESRRPTFDLKKDDWECVKHESRTHLQPMIVGKSTILMPMTTAVCIEYRRIGG